MRFTRAEGLQKKPHRGGILVTMQKTPTQPAAMIILISVVAGGLVTRLLSALKVAPEMLIAVTLLWIILTSLYLNKTGNARVGRIYLLVWLGLIIFTGLAIWGFNR